MPRRPDGVLEGRVENISGTTAVKKPKTSGRRKRKAKKDLVIRKPMPKYPWDEVKVRYVRGYEAPNVETGVLQLVYPSQLELAQEFDIPVDTISARSRRDGGWEMARKEWQESLRKAADAAALKAIQEAELRIRRKALRAAEKIIDRVAGNEAEGIPAAVDGNTAADELSLLAAALRRGQEVANAAIGIPKDGIRALDSGTPGVPEIMATVWARMRAARQGIVTDVQTVDRCNLRL